MFNIAASSNNRNASNFLVKLASKSYFRKLRKYKKKEPQMKAQLGPENLLIYSESIYENSCDSSQLVSMGQFEKSILFLVNESDFSDDNKALFNKICGAVELSEKDYKLIVLPNNTNALSIINELKPSKLICFDIKISSLSKLLDNVIQINGNQHLITNSISTISSNPTAKKSFWNALKKIID